MGAAQLARREVRVHQQTVHDRDHRAHPRRDQAAAQARQAGRRRHGWGRPEDLRAHRRRPASIKIGIRQLHYGSFRIWVKGIPQEWGWVRGERNGYECWLPTDELKALGQELGALGNAYNYDNSDVMTDYFDRRFYLSVEAFGPDDTTYASHRIWTPVIRRSSPKGSDMPTAQTYAQALNATRATGTKLTDPQHMALFCDSSIQILLGAVSPQLIWEGAQKSGLTTRELVELVHEDPDAARDLQWLWPGRMAPAQPDLASRSRGPKTMHFYTASIAHPNGETTRTQIAADSHADAKRLARRAADRLGREYTSIEVWQDGRWPGRVGTGTRP
jgi:hypothetical protein